jgi:hypothetical protein
MLQETRHGKHSRLDQATDPLNLYIIYNGLPMTLSLDEDGNGTFVLDIPDLGIHEVFSGPPGWRRGGDGGVDHDRPGRVMAQIEAYLPSPQPGGEQQRGHCRCFITTVQ